jgi:hypothetical protein
LRLKIWRATQKKKLKSGSFAKKRKKKKILCPVESKKAKN